MEPVQLRHQVSFHIPSVQYSARVQRGFVPRTRRRYPKGRVLHFGPIWVAIWFSYHFTYAYPRVLCDATSHRPWSFPRYVEYYDSKYGLSLFKIKLRSVPHLDPRATCRSVPDVTGRRLDRAPRAIGGSRKTRSSTCVRLHRYSSQKCGGHSDPRT